VDVGPTRDRACLHTTRCHVCCRRSGSAPLLRTHCLLLMHVTTPSELLRQAVLESCAPSRCTGSCVLQTRSDSFWQSLLMPYAPPVHRRQPDVLEVPSAQLLARVLQLRDLLPDVNLPDLVQRRPRILTQAILVANMNCCCHNCRQDDCT